MKTITISGLAFFAVSLMFQRQALSADSIAGKIEKKQVVELPTIDERNWNSLLRVLETEGVTRFVLLLQGSNSTTTSWSTSMFQPLALQYGNRRTAFLSYQEPDVERVENLFDRFDISSLPCLVIFDLRRSNEFVQKGEVSFTYGYDDQNKMLVRVSGYQERAVGQAPKSDLNAVLKLVRAATDSFSRSE